MAHFQTFGFSDEDFATLVGTSASFGNSSSSNSLNNSDTNKLLDLQKKLIRIEAHGEFMLNYLKHGIIPLGLRVRNIPGLFVDIKTFLNKWSMIATRCSRDLMILIISTAKDLAADIRKEIEELEDKLKKSTTVEDANKQFDIVKQDIASFSDYLRKRKEEKFAKDKRFYTIERTYPYLVESFFKSDYQHGAPRYETQQRINTFSDSSDPESEEEGGMGFHDDRPFDPRNNHRGNRRPFLGNRGGRGGRRRVRFQNPQRGNYQNHQYAQEPQQYLETRSKQYWRNGM